MGREESTALCWVPRLALVSLHLEPLLIVRTQSAGLMGSGDRASHLADS